MADKKKKRHWLSRLSFGTVSLVVSGLMVLSYLSVAVNPAKFWFFTIFGVLYPVILLIALFLFFWSLFRRSSMRGLLLAVLLPSLFFAGRYFQHRWKDVEGTPSLKVLSYNVGLFAHGNPSRDRLELADSVSAYLMRQNADIICLQEFYLPKKVNVDHWLKTHFPGYKAEYYVLSGKLGQSGNLTLSRRPVLARGKETFEKSTNMAIWTDIQLDSNRVRIYNCHFESYNIALSRLVRGLRDEVFLEETGGKMRRSIRGRAHQVDEVLNSMKATQSGSLVVGDFNDTPLSYTYFRLLRGRKDSFVRAGQGFGATYSALWPFLRIDYILYPKELNAVSYMVEDVKYSDHYPVICTYYETARDTK